MMSLFFMVFIGIPDEATCCQSDCVPELCLSLQSWASPIRSVATLCCPRTQKSFSSYLFFNSSDFSELQLERDGLAPRSSVTEHWSRSLAKVLLSEVILMFCLDRWRAEGWTSPGLVPSHLLSLRRAELLPEASEFSRTFLLCLCVCPPFRGLQSAFKNHKTNV